MPPDKPGSQPLCPRKWGRSVINGGIYQVWRWQPLAAALQDLSNSIIGIRYDPAAVYHNAVELSHQMPGSRLLTLDGWSHPTILNSPCVDEAADRYLRRPTSSRPAAPTWSAPTAIRRMSNFERAGFDLAQLLRPASS